MPSRYDTSTDNEESDVDPGRDVLEKNYRNRLERVAKHTKDELNKVLQRVDSVGRPTSLLRINDNETFTFRP